MFKCNGVPNRAMVIWCSRLPIRLVSRDFCRQTHPNGKGCVPIELEPIRHSVPRDEAPPPQPLAGSCNFGNNPLG